MQNFIYKILMWILFLVVLQICKLINLWHNVVNLHQHVYEQKEKILSYQGYIVLAEEFEI